MQSGSYYDSDLSIYQEAISEHGSLARMPDQTTWRTSTNMQSCLKIHLREQTVYAKSPKIHLRKNKRCGLLHDSRAFTLPTFSWDTT
jgi:hypothetical protein